MSAIAIACAPVIVIILAALAGYIGWFLAHKSFNDGYLLGYERGYRSAAEDLRPEPPKPTLKTVK